MLSNDMHFQFISMYSTCQSASTNARITDIQSEEVYVHVQCALYNRIKEDIAKITVFQFQGFNQVITKIISN